MREWVNKHEAVVTTVFAAALMLLIMVVVIVPAAVVKNFPVTERRITVAEKDFTEERFLVWDTEGRVYGMYTSILAGQYDVEEDYHGLRVGHTYEVTLRGKRRPAWGLTPNIVDYEEAP